MDREDSSDSQLQVKLVTKQTKYAVADTLYCIPTNTTVVGLNDLLNELLKGECSILEKEKIQFDFLINNELLRSKVGEYLAANNIPTELDVSIEYVEATPAPEPLDCLMHDDWVSCVHTANKWILSGCYDNSLHIWSPKGKHLLTTSAHSGPVKGVSWIDDKSDIAIFVSVSQDQTALLWEWNIEKNTARPLYVCRGHERSINCVDTQSSESVFVTGGWDCTLKLWSTDLSVSINDNEGESSSKKRKGENSLHTRVPKSTIKGHREAVSSVQWVNNDEILSASWDHTMKLWDAEYGGTKIEIIANKSIFNAHYSELNKLVVACGADRHVRLYDPRSNEGSIVKKTFSSHNEWVQAVQWSTTDSNQFVSGSYDSVLKLWDIRSCNTPLYDLLGHEDKILCCDWSKPDIIISGSADCTLRLFSVK